MSGAPVIRVENVSPWFGSVVAVFGSASTNSKDFGTLYPVSCPRQCACNAAASSVAPAAFTT